MAQIMLKSIDQPIERKHVRKAAENELEELHSK